MENIESSLLLWQLVAWRNFDFIKLQKLGTPICQYWVSNFRSKPLFLMKFVQREKFDFSEATIPTAHMFLNTCKLQTVKMQFLTISSCEKHTNEKRLLSLPLTSIYFQNSNQICTDSFNIMCRSASKFHLLVCL